MNEPIAPPKVPEYVEDEAPDTPLWVPVVGLILFALLLAGFAARASRGAPEASAALESAPVQVDDALPKPGAE